MADQAFRLDDTLSESTTTTVYRAYQVNLDRTVLLKVLNKSQLGDVDYVERFRREARACAALKSENIVQVFDLTELDGAPAIVMEFVEGRSLKEILELEGKQSPEFVRRALRDVLTGLSAAHKKGIFHRDIKPGNILVETSGTMKVTDFGLATVPRSPVLTMDGMVLGTPAYMSPEQARGEAVDARSDLFSLAVTLLELSTGKRIFDGQSYSECIRKVLAFTPRAIEEDLRQLPDDLSSILRLLLSPAKEERPASADEVLDLLAEGGTTAPKHHAAPLRRYASTAAFAILVIAALLYAFFSVKREHRATNVAVETLGVPPVREAKPDTAPQPATELPERSSRHESEIAAAGHHSALPSTAPVRPRGDSGSVVVRCVPWGMVYVNDIYLGQTPFSKAVRVKSGPCTITFSNPMFVPVSKRIVVPGDSEVVVESNFLDQAGFIVIRVLPWGEVYIDDHYRDTTPLDKPLIASAGTRKIRIHNPAFEDLLYEAAVVKGDTLRLSFNLEERKRP